MWLFLSTNKQGDFKSHEVPPKIGPCWERIQPKARCQGWFWLVLRQGPGCTISWPSEPKKLAWLQLWSFSNGTSGFNLRGHLVNYLSLKTLRPRRFWLWPGSDDEVLKWAPAERQGFRQAEAVWFRAKRHWVTGGTSPPKLLERSSVSSIKCVSHDLPSEISRLLKLIAKENKKKPIKI